MSNYCQTLMISEIFGAYSYKGVVVKQGASSAVWFSDSSEFCFDNIHLVIKNW